MTHAPEDRKLRRQLDLSPDANVDEQPVNIEWSWKVETGEAHEHFIVDLRGYLPQQTEHIPLARLATRQGGNIIPLGRSIQRARPGLINDFAPALKEWSKGRRVRPAFEHLNKIKWLFYFLDENNEIHPDLAKIDNAKDIKEEVGILFSDWLRRQPGLGSTRMNSIYSAVNLQITITTGSRQWRPSPFKTNTDATTQTQNYTQKQFIALLRMAKREISSFRANRARTIKIFKEIKQLDPVGGRPAYREPTPVRWKFQVRNAVDKDKDNLIRGANLQTRVTQRDLAIIPTVEYVSSAVLLIMLRTGVNEQPLIEIQPDGAGLKPGSWLQPNPFGQQYRTLVLWKNRSGKRDPGKKLRITIATNSKPTFYPIKLLRYQELLGKWCRENIDIALNNNESRRFSLAAKKARKSFWIYWGEAKWLGLNASHLRGTINTMIGKHAKQDPNLLNEDGQPITYSARAIRNAYLAFVAKLSGFSIPTMQQEATHSPDSASIQHYLKAHWAKTYRDDAIRKYQSAATAILDSSGHSLSPTKLIRALTTLNRDENVNNSESLTKVQAGLQCINPKSPPIQIYKIKGETDECPAANCHDCPSARCFVSSLPELALEILSYRRKRDTVSAHLWNGSDADVKLKKLEELFSRFNVNDQTKAIAEASKQDVPALTYSVIS